MALNAIKLVKACIGELLGVMALVYVGEILGLNAAAGTANLIAVASSHGLILFIFIVIVANFGDAHFNPAISFGFFVAGKMTLIKMLIYWVCQFAGGFLGAGLAMIRRNDFLDHPDKLNYPRL